MPRFAIRNPYLILVACLVIAVIGITSVLRVPVDLFPRINIPEVVVATFYNGMPPEEIETEITGRFERFFTLGSGIDHIESRSLPGVSIIKIFFQPGTNADSDVTMISNLAMANLRRLPPGTLPPVVLRFGGSSLPVCLVTLKGQGLTETQLRDLGQFAVRNQLATVPSASVPPPFGGKYRQIMIYTDPQKLDAYHLSLMDIVRAVNSSNLILPAGDAKIGPYDYYIYTNSQLQNVAAIDRIPVKTVGQRPVLVSDIGQAEDGHQIQTNVVRVDGQRSVYLPILKQGGNTNTIAVVNGVRSIVNNLFDVPRQLVAHVVFDQSLFVKAAIRAVSLGAALGLFLTCLLILGFLGSFRATVAVFLSVPLSALCAFIFLALGGSSINSMVLAGLALAFSRLIYNAVVVLENIFRHLDAGEPPPQAAELGGKEVQLAVLAATLGSAVIFFPVTFLFGVSRFLFSAMALAVVLSLVASYVIAMTVVPLFCAQFLRQRTANAANQPRRATFSRLMSRFGLWFEAGFRKSTNWYEQTLKSALARPWTVVLASVVVFALGLGLYPLLGVAFFPRTDAGQFVINLKVPSGTRIEVTEHLVKQVEDLLRQVVSRNDLGMIVSNIGVTPGFSSIYTSNSGSHTATIQVSLTPDHKIGSYEYMDRVRTRLARDLPAVSAFFQSGGMQDAVLNAGLPAPIDVQISGNDLEKIYDSAVRLSAAIRGIKGVRDAFIPQDLDYPALRLDIDREHASELGLTQKEVVDNVITALTSNGMIAPSYWIDPKTGNDYMLTVQYPESAIQSLGDLKSVPLRAPGRPKAMLLDAVANAHWLESPTEVDHYQIQRVVDIYVTTGGEDLGYASKQIQKLLATTKMPDGVYVQLRGMVEAMHSSFSSFGMGLCLAMVMLYLVLVPLFRSFLDPLLILLAIPLGITGAIAGLLISGATLNVMSLMGMVMLMGIAVSNSILTVEYTRRMLEEGVALTPAIVSGCVVRLRPVLMTSLATLIGLIPMAMKLGTGGEAYAPLAVAIIGGLILSFVSTLFLVPAAYLLAHRRKPGPGGAVSQPGSAVSISPARGAALE
ncbi:MAG TPA: efflux RND transporter permease subunit [Terriglobales bacterium]|jgi:multidrug efflux pump subunit AcrB|nr:efflux RND transporter permease subunit [Terriglobales bacterium]